MNEHLVSWASLTFSLPFIYMWARNYRFPEIGHDFYKTLIISGTLNLIATIYYLKAIRYGDISLVTPLVIFVFLTAMMIIFHMKAIMLTMVSYVIAIKRLSVLFSVLAGYFIFKEGSFNPSILLSPPPSFRKF